MQLMEDQAEMVAISPPSNQHEEVQRKKLFISYSMDPYPVGTRSDRERRDDRRTQRRRVRALADKLRQYGVDAWIDQYQEYIPPDSWTNWMEKQITKADYVLMICSPHYLECVTGEKNEVAVFGHGVRFEGKVIYGQIANGRNLNKFIPVFFDKINLNHVPQFLRGAHMYGPIEDPPEYGKEKFDRLLFKLLGKQPANTLPQRLGRPPFQ
ncbi:PREDICTED: adapter protein CIKS-like [Branchiostoma belcheri]|uniref:Adapter protein CIKS-like n=1 Tax=Branchiostoma belcheri TaxID=7741 RepID=A0A6P4Y8K2_BRABE|nr:PREDICTED: adapter protein CIKS-like [Branchiostoma belcheri]